MCSVFWLLRIERKNSIFWSTVTSCVSKVDGQARLHRTCNQNGPLFRTFIKPVVCEQGADVNVVVGEKLDLTSR